MNFRTHGLRALAFAIALGWLPWAAHADKKPQQDVKPMAGPRATVLRITTVYISPSTSSTRVTKEQIGREMVIVEHSGDWTKVFVNTDIEEQTSERDAPMVGEDQTPAPITGWMETKGIVADDTPNGDQILMGAAAEQEALASNPRGPANAAESARLLYRRVAEMFPNSPLAPEAAWRAADIQWQVEKADASTLPSANERDPVYRVGMNEDPLRKVIKNYPRTRWAAFAAYDLIDNKLCGNWEGSAECPEKEADLYLKYADEYPDGPRTAQALYQAVYRYAVLKDMYDADGNDKKSEMAHNQARNVAAQLKAHFADSDYTLRADALVYKLDEGVPVYGIERD